MAETVTLPDYLLEPNAVLLDNIPWRHGQVPDYTKANENWAQGRTVVHPAGSLGEIVTNLVKNWEKEVSYKTRREDYRTLDADKYFFSVNGGRKRDLEEMQRLGTYSALIGDQALFCSSKMSFEDSHKAFRRSMPNGFSFEVLEVLSGPPKVAFKWRHWGRMTGPLTCPLHNGLRMTAQPTNEVVSMIGMAYATLNDKYQIQDLEVYFDQNEPMSSMVRINVPGPLDATKIKAPAPTAEKTKASNKAASAYEATARTPSSAEMSKLDVSSHPREGTPRQQAQASRGIWGGIMNLLAPGSDEE